MHSETCLCIYCLVSICRVAGRTIRHSTDDRVGRSDCHNNKRWSVQSNILVFDRNDSDIRHSGSPTSTRGHSADLWNPVLPPDTHHVHATHHILVV